MPPQRKARIYSNGSEAVKSHSTVTPSLKWLSFSGEVIQVRTSQAIEFVDLTSHIEKHVRAHRLEQGSVTLFSRHTTAGIKINEAEDLLLQDFEIMLRRLCPIDQHYHHNDLSRRKPPISPDERANGHSHCMHLLLTTSETIPVIDSKLALGTWQRVFLVELDGPRTRELILQCQNYLPVRRFVGGLGPNGGKVPSISKAPS